MLRAVPVLLVVSVLYVMVRAPADSEPIVGGADTVERPDLAWTVAPPTTSAPATTVPSTAVPSSTTTAVTRTAIPTTAAPATVSSGVVLPPDTDTVAVEVVRVIDGDTLVLGDGRRVRLAQVDAPETDECFGDDARRALEALVAAGQVHLRRPPGAPVTDRYGRTVADVVVVSDAVIISANEYLIRQGAAEFYEQFADEDPDLGGRAEAAEHEARAAARGLWLVCA